MVAEKSSRTPGQAGVSAVEFGLILPVFLIILLGLIEYGFVFFVQLNCTNAAREGARVGVTREDTSQAVTDGKTKTEAYLANSGLSGATVSASFPDADTLEVSVRLPYVPLINFLPRSFLPAYINSRAAMRWELAP